MITFIGQRRTPLTVGCPGLAEGRVPFRAGGGYLRLRAALAASSASRVSRSSSARVGAMVCQ
jgi:hypothetical protein